MNIKINNEQTNNKTLEYKENAWSGKKTILYNGKELTQINKNLFKYEDGTTSEQFEVKGNYLLGVTINMFGKLIEIERKLTWYEILIAVLVFIPCVIISAFSGVLSATICGAIGGALGATSLIIVKQFDKLYLKIILSLELLIIGALLSYIFAFLIIRF